MEMKRLKKNDLTDLDNRSLDYYIKYNPYFTFYPLPHQLSNLVYVLRPAKKDNINDILISGTRGSGKTVNGAQICQMLLKIPDHRTAVVMRTVNITQTSGSIFSILNTAYLDNPDIKVRKSTPLTITNTKNNSLIEFYSASNSDEFAGRFTGKSYSTIIIDESSYLSTDVLTFAYGSLRQPKSMLSPKRMIHLSNPSINQETTTYLREKYIIGEDTMFLPSTFRDNTYLDSNYESTLRNLDYISQQYFLHANWFYEVAQGDLISSEEFDNCCVSLDSIAPVQKFISVDPAGKGADLSVVSVIYRTKDNKFFIHSQYGSRAPNCDKLIMQVVKKTFRREDKGLIIIEGGYQSTYLTPEVKDKLYKSGFSRIRVIEEPATKSKYDRAMALVQQMLNNNILINKSMRSLSDFKGELLNIVPNYKGSSPNYLDSVSIFVQYAIKNLYTKGGGIKMLNLQSGETIGFNLPEAPNIEDYDTSSVYQMNKFNNKCHAVAKANKKAYKEAWRTGKI